MKRRVLLSLDKGDVALADQLAEQGGTSRSALVALALRSLAEGGQESSIQASLPDKAEAHALVQKLARQAIPDGGPDSTEVIRAWRNRDRLTRAYERDRGL